MSGNNAAIIALARWNSLDAHEFRKYTCTDLVLEGKVAIIRREAPFRKGLTLCNEIRSKELAKHTGGSLSFKDNRTGISFYSRSRGLFIETRSCQANNTFKRVGRWKIRWKDAIRCIGLSKRHAIRCLCCSNDLNAGETFVLMKFATFGVEVIRLLRHDLHTNT